MDILICMGSSCYSRGNSLALENLEQYIKEESLESSIKLTGALCLGNCTDGPIITIDGKKYQGIHPDCIIDLVKHHLRENQ